MKKNALRIFLVFTLLVTLGIAFASPVSAAPADRYLKATGDWDNNNTWSATDGGAAGVSFPVAGDNVFITANGNGLTLTLTGAEACGSFVGSGGSTATLAGAQTLTVGGNVTLLATMTVPNTITFTVTGTGNFAGSTLATLGAINLNGTAHTVSGAFTCTVLTRNGTATKTDTITLTSGTTLTCTTFAMIGNSVTNRLLVQSSTLGTAATVTATNWTGFQNVDCMDITATNAVDLSGGSAGDCGGNTGIAFTTAAAQISNAAGNWSTLATWQDGVGTDRVPLPQDDVSCSHNVTVDMPRIGKSITFTGTPTITLGNNIDNYGSFTLATGMTYTPAAYIHVIRGRGNFTYTTNGKTVGVLQFRAFGGTYTLGSSLTTGNYDISIANGTFTTANYNISTRQFYSLYTTARTINLGSSTITVTYAGDSWGINATNLTFDAGTSTIVVNGTNAAARTFVGADLTYNHVRVEGAGNYALTITGSNTFSTCTVDRSVAAKTIIGTAGTTQTFTNFVCPVSGTTVLTLSSTGAFWTIAKAGGSYIALDYLNLSNNTASPVNTWGYGENSTIGANVVDWGVLLFYIHVVGDGVDEYEEVLAPGITVPDNANDWIINRNNVMPYMEYYKHTVAGVEHAWYQPNYMVEGTDFAGTADAGSTATQIRDAALTQANDYWNGARLTIVTTTDTFAPQGETAVITDFIAATDDLIFEALSDTVDAGDTYTVNFATLIDRSYYGLDFDGDGDEVDCGADALLDIATIATIVGWVNIDSDGENNEGSIVDRRDATPDGYRVFVGQEAGGLVSIEAILDCAVADAQAITNVDIPINTDGEVVAVYNRLGTSHWEIYWNGVLETLATDTAAGGAIVGHTANNFFIGDNAAGNRCFDGEIDEVSFYQGDAWTAAEVLADYNAGVGSYTPADTTNLEGQWHIENGTGATATDTSGNGNDGTITNALWINGIVPRTAGVAGINDSRLTWGVNSDITIQYGEMVSYESTVSTVGVDEIGADIPTVGMPSGWFGTTFVGAGLPFHETFLDASTRTGIPEQSFYVWLIFGIAMSLAVITIILTRSIVVGAAFFTIVMAYGANATIIAWWIVFVFILLFAGIMFLSSRSAMGD